MSMLSEHNSKIQIPISSEAYLEAEAAYAQQSSTQRQQTYLNILAIHAVQTYLQWLAIPMDWRNCDSYNPTLRCFLNVADLEVLGYGRLECRPVLPGATMLEVPSEVQSDRIGYVAVQFDEDLETATLLGFSPTAAQTAIPLDSLASMDSLLDIVGNAPAVVLPTAEVSPELLNWQEPISLTTWLNHRVANLVETGWQTLAAIETFMSPEAQMELAFNVRRGAAPVKCGKLIDVAKGSDRVALVVGIHEATPPETDISVEVYPTGEQGYLPKNLELIVLDDMGKPVMQAQARRNKKIQMEFSGEPGEAFSIRLAMGDFSMTEAFQL